MTMSTGKRELQRQREKLFLAEIELRGVQRHLLNAYGFATFYQASEDALGYMAAFGLVNAALCAVLAELKEIV